MRGKKNSCAVTPLYGTQIKQFSRPLKLTKTCCQRAASIRLDPKSVALSESPHLQRVNHWLHFTHCDVEVANNVTTLIINDCHACQGGCRLKVLFIMVFRMFFVCSEWLNWLCFFLLLVLILGVFLTFHCLISYSKNNNKDIIKDSRLA